MNRFYALILLALFTNCSSEREEKVIIKDEVTEVELPVKNVFEGEWVDISDSGSVWIFTTDNVSWNGYEHTYHFSNDTLTVSGMPYSFEVKNEDTLELRSIRMNTTNLLVKKSAIIL